MSRRLDRPAALRVLAVSGGSLVLWGGWAFVTNYGHGLGAASTAAATQGFISLSITFLMTVVLERVSRACHGTGSKVVLPTMAAVVLHAGYTIGTHWLMGTPALWASVAPIIVVGGIGYSLTYSTALAVLAHPDVRLPRLLVRLSRRRAQALRASPRTDDEPSD